MKNRYFAIATSLLVGVASLSACKEKDGRLPDSAAIHINGRDQLPTNKQATTGGETQQPQRTAKQVCEIGTLCLVTQGGVGYLFKIAPSAEETAVGFIDVERTRLSFRAEVIQSLDDHPFFRANERIIIEDWTDLDVSSDTVAYIPDAQRMSALAQLEELFKDRDNNWSEIYRIFNDAFIFVPCTGAEYKKLVEEGRN